VVLDGRRPSACVRPIAMGVHLDNGGALINQTTIADNKITGIETININTRAQQTGISGVVSPSHSGLPAASSKKFGRLYSVRHVIGGDLEGDPGLALPELQTAFWRMMVA